MHGATDGCVNQWAEQHESSGKAVSETINWIQFTP